MYVYIRVSFRILVEGGQNQIKWDDGGGGGKEILINLVHLTNTEVIQV